MGVWGTGVFDSDFASDVRDEFLDLVRHGRKPEDATNDVFSLTEPSALEVAEFWIALAVVQSQFGVLTSSVRERALQEIDSGRDLERWKSLGTDLKRRQESLQRARNLIVHGPRKVKKLSKSPDAFHDPLRRGDVFSFQLKSKQLIIMRVLGVFFDRDGEYPIVEICDWIGTEVPSIEGICALPFRRFHPFTQFQMVRKRRNFNLAKRIQKLAISQNVERDAFQNPEVLFWEDLDVFVEDEFKSSSEPAQNG